MGPSPQTRRVCQVGGDLPEEAAARRGRGRGRSTRASRAARRSRPRSSSGRGVAEARADVGEVGAGDHQHAAGPPLHQRARAPRGTTRPRDRAPGRAGVACASPRPQSTGTMRAAAARAPSDVAEEDRLELQRVLALVEVLVLAHVEAARRRELVDGLVVGLERAERGVEGLGADREGAAHGRVRGAEQDEGVDARVERPRAGRGRRGRSRRRRARDPCAARRGRPSAPRAGAARGRARPRHSSSM